MNASDHSGGAWEKLCQVAILGAEYDSNERNPHPKCLEGTREKLLGHSYELLDNGETNRLVWLNGTAGVGKSAVAFTIAARMKGLNLRGDVVDEKRLAGTFFFSRNSTDRSSTGHFFETLAYQLATNFPSIMEDLTKAIRKNPALLRPEGPLAKKMDALFLQPLRRLRLRLCGCPPLIFVVDALDECTSQPEIAQLISLLGQVLRDPDIPITHILLTSRSEAHVSNAIHRHEVELLVYEIPVKIEGEGDTSWISLDGADVDKDISKFLEYSFTEKKQNSPTFPQPTEEELVLLASRAGRRFIVATTMMKFIDDGYKDPHNQLKLMLELSNNLLPGTEVYKLYDSILSTCTDPTRAYRHLSVVAALVKPLPVSQISELLGPGEGKDVERMLMQLRSIMEIPADSSFPVNIYHSSVRDYVLDPSTRSRFVGQEMTFSPHSLLALSCFHLMTRDLPKSTSLLDEFSKLDTQRQAMESHPPRNLMQSLGFMVESPTTVGVLTALVWLRGDRSPTLYPWLEGPDGRAWLRTQEGGEWLLTSGGVDWLQTGGGLAWMRTEDASNWLRSREGDAWLLEEEEQWWLSSITGKQWLKTDGGRRWLETDSGRRWMMTRDSFFWTMGFERHSHKTERGCKVSEITGRVWLQTCGGRVWLQTENGRVWVETQSGQQWLETAGGYFWLFTNGGKRWLQTDSGRWWLHTGGGRGWLRTGGGREWLHTGSGREWLQTDGGREWLQTRSGREWLQTHSGREWLHTDCGQEWLQNHSGREWLHTDCGREWLHTDCGREWLHTDCGQEWLHTDCGREWLHTDCGREWLRTDSGREWLRTDSGREWLQTDSGRQWLQTGNSGPEWLQTGNSGGEWLQTGNSGGEWLQTGNSGGEWLQTSNSGGEWLQTSNSGGEWLQTSNSGGEWLQTSNSGREWLQTDSGREWLQTSDSGREWLWTDSGREWLQTDSGGDWLLTPDGRCWLRTNSGRWWLQADGGRWLQTNSGQQWLQTNSTREWLHTSSGRQWLRTSSGRQWVRASSGRRWLRTSSGRRWLQTDSGRQWLQTHGGGWWLVTHNERWWLQTDSGREWLQTDSRREWLQTDSRRELLRTDSGQEWLQTNSGREWLQTNSGREWLRTDSGQGWLQTNSGQEWLRIDSGREWLQTSSGRAWLQADSGRTWLQTVNGLEWLQADSGRQWLQTSSGREWLQTHSGRKWLQTYSGEEWLQTDGAREWLQTYTAREWLRTDTARAWLQSPHGREWLQTPNGQAWKSSPAASFWVHMQEFSNTVEAIENFIATPQISSSSTYQIIERFKNLPDFLMLPTWLALTPDHHTSSTLPPAIEIIHAIGAFEHHTKKAREGSQSASGALLYACHNWVIHLSQPPNLSGDTLNQAFSCFWDNCLASWLEITWCSSGLRPCLIIFSNAQNLLKKLARSSSNEDLILWRRTYTDMNMSNN